MREHRRGFWINLIIILVLAGVVTARSLAGGGSQAGFDLREDGITFTGPEFTVSVAFADVASIEYRPEFDRGDCVDGGSKSGYTYGTWENEELGRYTLFVLTKVDPCVVVTEKDGDLVVFNVESAKTTEEFAQSLTEYLENFK